MGNALGNVEALIYFRAWSAPEVAELLQVLRRERLAMTIDKKMFEELIGHKNQEAGVVFSLLDMDSDGKVDAFEVLATLALWCCASWDDKCRLLFACFDFNRKGGLLPVELSFLACSVARAAECFAELPGELASTASLKAETSAAFGGLEAGASMSEADFVEWFGGSPSAQLLRGFVEKHQGPMAAKAVEATIQERLRLLEYRVGEQAQEVAQLHGTSDELRAEAMPGGRPEREEWERLWGCMDELLQKMDSAASSQRSEIAELAASLSTAVAEGGAEALLEPQARSQHGRLAADVEALEQDLRDMLRSAGELLTQLLELRGGIVEAERVAEEEGPSMPPARRATVDSEAVRRRLRVLDREVRRRRGKRPVESSAPTSEHGGTLLPSASLTGQGTGSDARGPKAPDQSASSWAAQEAPPAEGPLSGSARPDTAAGADDVMAIVVAFAEFVPPASSDTQMLSLKPGDVITALGQEAQGWWYGRKPDGSEGWFPPSYVKLKEAANSGSLSGTPKP